MNNVKYIGSDLGRMTDNELQFLDLLTLIIFYSDPYSFLLISKEEDRIVCHITFSNIEWKDEIIHNLMYCNRVLKIKVIFSKSLGISNNIISFQIDI